MGDSMIRRWSYDGMVLLTRDGGVVSLEELKEFVGCVELLDEDAQQHIYVHAYGLRATRIGGEGGPSLDWRDWD